MANCSLCKKLLRENERDHHVLDHRYEFPYRVEWKYNGVVDATIHNKIVRSICEECLEKIMNAVNSCIKED